MYKNSFNSEHTLQVKKREYVYYDLNRVGEHGAGDPSRLPCSLKVLLENLLRFEDGSNVSADDITRLANWDQEKPKDHEIAFRPARVLMQDFTGVPAVADLAAMRDAVVQTGHDPQIINPLTPVDLVIDHSVMVDHFGSNNAFDANVKLEIARNSERYRFLRWGQNAFSNFSVVPPGTGICHQVNLEYLARVVWTKETANGTLAYPDTLVGTDSHTTMINGLGVLGWGVGGIEAEAAMLGQPISMLIPKVVGVQLTGSLREGVTATDLVLVIVERLRQHGVVGSFVEFFGTSLNTLSLADRATIANMAPEYGATCGFFPIDAETLSYLHLSARPEHTIDLVEAYAKQQGLWRDDSAPPHFTEVIKLDISKIEPSVAGPKRPQDRVPLDRIHPAFELAAFQHGVPEGSLSHSVPVDDKDYSLSHGDVVIAAITSCTNTSNPAVMLAAGMVAKKALARGLTVKPWVKTSLAPGSKVVSEYLEHTNLQDALDGIGFNLVGYGCTTCIGNSGPLPSEISNAISDGNLVAAAVLSGNRNFEGRIHQEVKTNWLASPPLVVAFALAGTVKIDFNTMPLAKDTNDDDVFLRDLWPTSNELQDLLKQVTATMFERQYADIFTGPPAWQSMKAENTATFGWNESTYVRQPPFFAAKPVATESVEFTNAIILVLLGDSVTTDHISPAGAIQPASPAGEYLQQHDVAIKDFNSYGSRRGNHEVMMRGSFANIRIRNEMIPDIEGGYTIHIPTAETVSIYDAAQRYAHTNTPLVVIAGKEYGAGSSRDWAAKGTKLLGINAVIAESFERIHRSNLVGMGVIPLEFPAGVSRSTLNLTGTEQLSLSFPRETQTLEPKQTLCLTIDRADESRVVIEVRSRIDTPKEIEYFRAGGILQYVLDNLLQEN